ncbi:unnamed protein product [Pedinophyceae sp. YPF-701]|nr:unnamed protein product [Pedinophyceae sp. YPF-701]
MGALYAAGATSSSATSSSSENSDASAGSSSEDEGLWAATRQRVKRAAGGARRPKRTLRRKRVSVSRSRSPTPPRRTRHEPQAVKWEDVREGMLRDVPGLPRGPTRAEIEAAEAERAAAEAAEQRLAAARRELREERRRERIAAAAAAAAGGRAEGEDVVRSAQDAALRQHAERRVRSREGAWGKALAGAAGGAALLFEPGVSFGPAIPSLPGDVDAARVVAVHFAVPHKRLLPGVLRLMTSGGYNRATRGGARFEDHALTVIGAQLCADAQPGGPAPTRLLVAVAVGAPGVPATAAARQLSAQLAGASLAGCGATHGPDATGPSVGALVDAVVAGPGDFCRELAMWHSPPGDEACGDPTLAVAVARVGAAGGAGWAWEALCLALERAMADGLDVCGLRTCYHAASDAQAAAAAAGKRARHPALMPPPAPGRATAPGPDVAVAVRGPAAGARWMALLGPHVPSVARVTDPASVNAALPGECDHSPLTSIYDAATAAAEAVWLFGGRVDAAADPAAWLAQRADAATTAAAPPTPPPAIAQPTCAPQRGGLLSGLRAKAAAAEETNHAPAPTRTSSLRPLAALCCAPASRCAILAPADSPSDLRACSAALGALGATGFACEALSVVHVPDDAAAGELLCGVRGTGHAVWLAASGGDGVQRTAAAPSDIAGRRVAVGVFARAGAAAWAEDAAAEAARRAAAATGGEVRVAALLSASAGPAVAGKGRWPAAAPVDAPLRLATRRPAPHESDALLTSVAAFRAAHGLPTVEDAARVPHAPEIALAAVAAPAHRLADAATAVQNILETLCAATGGAAPLRVLGVRLEPDIRNAVQRHLHPVPHGHAAAIAAGSLHALHGPHVLVALQGVDAHKRLRGVAEEHAGIAAVSGGPVDGLAAAARAFCASELATPSGGESVAEVLAGGRPTTAACLVAAPSGAAGAAARALPRVLRAMHRLGFTLRGMKHVREGVFSGDGGHAVLLCASRQGAASCLQAALADGSGTSASGLLGVAARMVPWAGSWEAMGRRFESAPQGGCGAVWEERLEAMRGEGGDSRLLQASVLSVACCDADAVPEGAVQRRGADAMDGAELSDVAGCIETLVEAGFTLLDTRLTNGTLMARRARATPGRTSTSPDRPTLHLVVGRDNAVAGLGMRLQQAQQRAGAHGHSSDPLADVVRFAACAADAAEAREWLARLERGQA